MRIKRQQGRRALQSEFNRREGNWNRKGYSKLFESLLTLSDIGRHHWNRTGLRGTTRGTQSQKNQN